MSGSRRAIFTKKANSTIIYRNSNNSNMYSVCNSDNCTSIDCNNCIGLAESIQYVHLICTRILIIVSKKCNTCPGRMSGHGNGEGDKF